MTYYIENNGQLIINIIFMSQTNFDENQLREELKNTRVSDSTVCTEWDGVS